MAVPGTIEGALRTNCINTPGWFGNCPAIRPWRPKLPSEGPRPPRGHFTSGKVWQATQPLSATICRPRAMSASPTVGLRSGGPSQATRPAQASTSQQLAKEDESFTMRTPPMLKKFTGLLLLLVLASACTDRMAPSDDRWGRSGELIAMSGGEGGARYACVSCHGARGEGNGFDAPRLAGLPAGYLQKQLQDYAAGLRPHRVMGDVARFLDSHERVLVANHYAEMPAQALPLPLPGGEAIAATTPALYIRACQQCHGAFAAGTELGPPLNAQPALYLAQQLQDWQVSKRRNDGGLVMLHVAQQLRPVEVRQLSLYLAQMPIP